MFFSSDDPVKFREDLLNIARTTLSSKILTQHKEHFAELAVNAILRLKTHPDLDAIQIIKKLGSGLEDSYLDEGKQYFLFGGKHLSLQLNTSDCQGHHRDYKFVVTTYCL